MVDGSLIFDVKELFKIYVQLCYQRYCKMQNKPEIYFVNIYDLCFFIYVPGMFVCVHG